MIFEQILDHLSMIENRNESELEAHLRRVVKHTGNLSGMKSDRGNEKSGLRTVSSARAPKEPHRFNGNPVFNVIIRFLLYCVHLIFFFFTFTKVNLVRTIAHPFATEGELRFSSSGRIDAERRV